ncbi:MAG TPA: Lpg1974 family pore-forming outer membrane protein [Rhabdochlamydiaceae bacterium]|nr:Lpg1974 family pore-forming outer membrane protein [Rhabdochlamydiaceae bacterium]
MNHKRYSLLVLSIAFLCNGNVSGALFADSSDRYAIDEELVETYLDDADDEEYEAPRLAPKRKERANKKVSQNQQRPMRSDQTMQRDQMMRSDQMMQRNQMCNEEVMTGPVCCPEICEDCCYCNVCPPTKKITPLAGPCVMNGMGVYLTADFIYWTARQREMELAATTGFSLFPTVTAPTPPHTAQGKVIRFDEKYKPGFKVGLGLDFCHDGWDAFVQYTWLRYNVSKSKSVPNFPNTQTVANGASGTTLWDAYWGLDGNLQPISANLVVDPSLVAFFAPSAAVYGNISGKWHLQFNVVDLELGRNFYISRRLMLRPHFGLKGGWQEQKFSIFLSNGITNLTSGPVLTTVFTTAANESMKQKLNDWGIGPRAGLNTAWHLSREFSLLGNIALTGYFERFTVKRFDYSVQPTLLSTNAVPGTATAGIGDSEVHLKNKFSTIEPVIEWMLGVRWEMWFLCDQYHFSLDAGWEEQVWFGQNQFLRNQVMVSPEGNLVLGGLTVHARFDF